MVQFKEDDSQLTTLLSMKLTCIDLADELFDGSWVAEPPGHAPIGVSASFLELVPAAWVREHCTDGALTQV